MVGTQTLVTGAFGAIGSAVIQSLVSKGQRPIALDVRSDATLVNDVLGQIDVEIADLRDAAALRRIFEGRQIDRVIHLAAVLGHGAQEDPPLAVAVNIQGTVSICELALEHSVDRVVFASTKGVYRRVEGEYAHPQFKPLGEDYPIGPQRVYDTTKYAAEQLGLNFSRTRGLDFVALRFAATYGPGRMARHGSMAVRSAIVENAFHGVPMKVPGGGDQQDDFVYTKDAAQALVKAADADGLSDRVFNIGTGRPATLSQAAEVVLRYLPNAEIEIGPGLDYGTGTGRYCIFDISRARQQLGYEPEYDLERGIGDHLSTLERLQATSDADPMREARERP